MLKSANKEKSPIKTPKSPKYQNSPEVIKILAIRDNFHKNIQMPIQNIQSIYHSKSPQRCLVHNTILTLYCQIDRKPLCANCMYQQETHRKHRVIPIGRAMTQIKEDNSAFEIKIDETLRQCRALSQRVQQSVIRNQRFFPSIVEQLKKYYKGLTEMLKQKQREQIQQIKARQQKIKNEGVVFDHCIKQIATFLNTKLNMQVKNENDQVIVTRRGILEITCKAHRIINYDINQISDQQADNNIVDFNMFNDIYDLVKSKLVVLLPGVNIIPRIRNMSAKNLSKTSHFERMQKQKQRVKSKSPMIEKRGGSGIKKKVSFNFE